jgi:hypothetical protein
VKSKWATFTGGHKSSSEKQIKVNLNSILIGNRNQKMEKEIRKCNETGNHKYIYIPYQTFVFYFLL